MGICQFEKDKYNSKICCEENKRKKRKKETHTEKQILQTTKKILTNKMLTRKIK